jgi:hypothetical protein
VLDTQVKYLDNKSLESLGDWISRKWYRCQEKQKSAEDVLGQLGISTAMLREQWDEQVKAQTKPAPRRLLSLPR